MTIRTVGVILSNFIFIDPILSILLCTKKTCPLLSVSLSMASLIFFSFQWIMLVITPLLPWKSFFHQGSIASQGFPASHKTDREGPWIMEELGGKQSVLRLASQFVDIMDIIEEVLERDDTLPFVTTQIKVVNMVREERFIEVQLANSSEFVFKNPLQLVVFLPPFAVIEKDAINITGKSNGSTTNAPIHADDNGSIFNIQLLFDSVE